MKDRKSIGAKITAGLTVLGAFIAVVCGTAYYSTTQLAATINDARANDLRRVELVGAVESASGMMAAQERGMMMAALMNDAPARSAYSREWVEAAQRMTSTLRTLAPLIDMTDMRSTHTRLSAELAEAMEMQAEYAALLRGKNAAAAMQFLVEKLAPRHTRIQLDARNMSDQERATSSFVPAPAQAETTTSRWIAAALGAVALLIAGITAVATRRALNGLRLLAGDIGDGAERVFAAAVQASTSSRPLARGAAEQAATLEAASVSTEEVNSMTRKNAENGRAAADETAAAERLLQETDAKFVNMVRLMQEIRSSSEKTSKVIKVIDEIAFQTNILALNAAVEAARAGEAGMGFAVIADEVRNLAQRCAKAAKETSDLIEESIKWSKDGKLRLDEIASCVSKVLENTGRIKLLTNEVHAGSREQAKGIERIARAVAQMQQATAATASGAEEGSSAGEEMSAHAERFRDAVQGLRNVAGRDSAQARGPVEPKFRARSPIHRHPNGIGDERKQPSAESCPRP